MTGKDYSIMTVTRGGTVSYIRDLTLEEVSKIYERLDHWYGQTHINFSVHKDFLQDGCYGVSFGHGHGKLSRDGDIEERQVFGPEGFTHNDLICIESWPKVQTIYTDEKGKILSDEYQEHKELAASYRGRG